MKIENLCHKLLFRNKFPPSCKSNQKKGLVIQLPTVCRNRAIPHRLNCVAEINVFSTAWTRDNSVPSSYMLLLVVGERERERERERESES